MPPLPSFRSSLAHVAASFLVAVVAAPCVTGCERSSPPEEPLGASTAALGQSFAAGSLIIPMDTTYQDSGMLKAYGLVYRLTLAGVPVHWVISSTKAAGGSDFAASATDVQTNAAIDAYAYRGGPFVIDAADAATAMPIISAWQASNVTTVHQATAPFSGEVARRLTAAPSIAVFLDGSEDIAFDYLNAAGIPDSLGQTWPAAKAASYPGRPDILSAAQIAGSTTTNHADGSLLRASGAPAYCHFTSMHYGVSNHDAEVVAETRSFLSKGAVHFFAECQAVNAFENDSASGRLLSTSGFTAAGKPATATVLLPSSPFAQLDGTFGTQGGSEPAYDLSGGALYATDSLLVQGTGAAAGKSMVFLTGYLDGVATNGKVSYLGGHSYSTKVPISANPGSQGARLFLNGIIEAPCASDEGQPSLTLTKVAPAATVQPTVTFTLSYANNGAGTATGATLSDQLPTGTTFVSATGGGTASNGKVTWSLGDLAPGAAGSVSVTATLGGLGTYANHGLLSYQVGNSTKTLTSNTTTTSRVGCLADPDCGATQFCDTATNGCVAKLANGTPIPTIANHTPALTGDCSDPVGAAVCTSAVCDANDDACGYLNGDGQCSASNAAVVCRTGACDPDGRCGWANGTSGCTTGADARCRSDACSTDGTCMPAGGCNADGDCSASQYCDTGVHACAAKIANGGALIAVTGHTPSLSPAVCGSASSSTVGGVECRWGVCDLDDACGWKNGTSGCTTGADARCRSGECSANGACMPAGGCNVDADCGGDQWCDESTSACTAKLPNASPMPNDPPHTAPTLDGTCTSDAALLVCQTGVCDADARCGWIDGTAGCDANQADARCRSGACSTNGTCKPLSGCNADGDCASSQFCDTGTHTCTPKLGNGAALVAVAGHTPDLSSGTCGSTSSSSVGAVECATAVCDLDDACGWKNATAGCTASANDARCRTGVCDADAKCGWKNGTAGCTPRTADARCRSGACSANGACMPAGGCNVDADCAGGLWCNESTNTCTAKLANATPMPSDPPHASPTLDGTCTAQAATLVCQTSVCDTDAKCGWADGTAGCTAGADARCRSTSCSANGTCKPLSGCNADADCTATQYCDTGTHACAAKIANGSPVVAVTGHSPDLSVASCTTNASIGPVECQTGVCDADDACGWKNGSAGCSAGTDARCRTGVCDTDTQCGWADGTSGCTPSTQDARCRSGACGADGKCMPAGGCNLDADCSGGKWCAEASHVCKPKLSNGTSMPNDAPHTTPTLDGTCRSDAATLVCTSGVCDLDDACGWKDGTVGCVAGVDARCRSGACSVNGTCRPVSGCNVDGDCTTAQYCDTGTHACAAKILNGGALVSVAGHTPDISVASCTADVSIAGVECVTGVCDADDRCGWLNGTAGCAEGADDRCRTGVCDPDSACGWANGTSGCTPGTADARCRSGACGGAGVCMPVGGCNVDADCAGGTWCDEAHQACKPRVANGSAMPSDPPHTSPVLDGTCSATAASLVCVTQVCDADDLCGWADGTAGCAPGVDARCRSGECSANGTCKPLGGCNADPDCAASQYCNTAAHACAPKIANGDPVVAVAGHTPDLSVASCVTNASIATVECLTGACDADSLCGLQNGTSGCTSGADARCRTGVCDVDSACGWKNGTSGCDAGKSDARCRSGVCAADGRCVAVGGCNVDADCASAEFCDTAASTCRAKLANGVAIPTIAGHDPALTGACTADAALAVCASGVCDTDGKCGYANGDGSCYAGNAATVCRTGACDLADHRCGIALGDPTCFSAAQCRAGICVTTGPRPNTCENCGSDADCVFPLVACDGTTYQCVQCTATNAAACQGATPFCDPTAESCVGCSGNAGSSGAFACPAGAPYCAADGSCSAACQRDSDCGAGNWCDAGTCVPQLPNGTPMPTVASHDPTLDGTCTAIAATAVCASGVCDAATATCGIGLGDPGCTSDAQCQAGRCALAGPNANHCEPCLTDADCSGTTPVCDAATNHCVACTATNLGACGGALPVCDAGSETCVPCNGDFGTGATAPCPSSSAPYCAASGACGVCTSNADCAGHAGPICNPSTGSCGTACSVDADCAPQWCDDPSALPGGGVCTPKIANGKPLPADAPIAGECTTANGARVCAAGVCETSDDLCGLKNGSDCQSNDQCRSAVCNADGECGDPNGTPCTTADTCRSDVCASDGECGSPDGDPCTTADTCRSGECQGGHCGLPDAGADADAGDADVDAGDADAADADAADADADAADAPDADAADAPSDDARDASSEADAEPGTSGGAVAQDDGDAIQGGGCACHVANRRADDGAALSALVFVVGVAFARRRRETARRA